jgi:hypothetical protein
MSELLKPPTVPVAILNFFACQPDFPAVAGDISEEFHQRAQKSGAKAAKRWYWREAFRNAWALTAREFLRTPLRTTLVALSCFLAVSLIAGWFTRHGLVSGRSPWDVFATQLLFLLAAGSTGGKLLPRREWALALTFTALSICIAGGLRLVFPVPTIHFSAAQFAAVVVGSGLRQGAFWLGCLRIRIHPRSFAITSIAPSIPLSSAPRNPLDPG